MERQLSVFLRDTDQCTQSFKLSELRNCLCGKPGGGGKTIEMNQLPFPQSPVPMDHGERSMCDSQSLTSVPLQKLGAWPILPTRIGPRDNLPEQGP